MITEIIAIYAITDDLLNALGHREDCRVQLSDAEVITTALVAARFFGGNQHLAQQDLKEHGLMPQMLTSRGSTVAYIACFCPYWASLTLWAPC